MTTAIIWGAGGQDGYYLSSLLKQQGVNVIGISRQNGFLHTSLTSFEDVSELIKEHQPEYIFHLAANSTTRHFAWKENHDTISTGTIHILEAVKKYVPTCKVFLSSSGLQFHNAAKPIKETDPFEATSIYAVSRIHSVYAARYYRTLGLKVYVGYFFNHDSPLRSERHVNKKVITTAKRISEGSNEKLEIGDMSVMKEFGYAGDIVKAIWTLVKQDAINECVIGTGKAYSIEQWIDICFSLHDLNWNDHVSVVQDFKPEYKVLVSDPSTIFSLGWSPEVSISDLAKMML